MSVISMKFYDLVLNAVSLIVIFQGACPTLPRPHHHHHMLVEEWPCYPPGVTGSSRRQPQVPSNIPPPAHPQNILRGVSTFHRNTSSPGGSHSQQTASTQMNYDMSPLLQIPVFEEESEIVAEMPLMQDKIESTV